MLRNVWVALGWLWIVAVFYLSLAPIPPQPLTFDGLDKLEHALAYALLVLWFCQIYVAQFARIRLSLALLLMGVGIEVLQGMTGYRYFEYADIVANSTGIVAGLGLARTSWGQLLSARLA